MDVVVHEVITCGYVGSIEDNTRLFVKINRNDYVVLPSFGLVPMVRSTVDRVFTHEPKTRVLLLEMIWVPESMRKQGIATTIIHDLRKYAQDNKYHFSIGAVSDETGAIDKIMDGLLIRPEP